MLVRHLLFSLALLLPCAALRADDPVRSDGGGDIPLSLDGVPSGYVVSADGGDLVPSVVLEPSTGTFYAKKHLGQPKYDDITLQAYVTAGPAFLDWISSWLNGKYARKDGSIIAANYNMSARQERDFAGALITGVKIPSCDGSSKDPAYLTVTISPEWVRSFPVTGQAGQKPPDPKQKAWLPSNFRCEIDGLDCKKVTKVDSFTVKQSVATDDCGNPRDPQLQPTSIDFPDVSVTVEGDSLQSWMDWYQDFAVNGNNGDGNEKSGRLVFLNDQGARLFQVTFAGLGVYKSTPEKAESGNENIRRVKFTMYCERMNFSAGDAIDAVGR